MDMALEIVPHERVSELHFIEKKKEVKIPIETVTKLCTNFSVNK